ncbi:MAG: transposase [Candidatus Saccharibacteria bacterium]|nr:transposase [Candidatus Saccharibacteria bacterium]
MKRKPETQRILAVRDYHKGKKVKDICREYDCAKSTFYSWVRPYTEKKNKYGTVRLKDLQLANDRIKKLENELESCIIHRSSRSSESRIRNKKLIPNTANIASTNCVTLFLCLPAPTITIYSAIKTKRPGSLSVAPCYPVRSRKSSIIVARLMASNASVTHFKNKGLQLAKSSSLSSCAKWAYSQSKSTAKLTTRRPSSKGASTDSGKSLTSMSRILSGSAT